MFKTKYIIFNHRTPVLFHEVISHDSIPPVQYVGKPTSAGFVTLTPVNVDCRDLNGELTINATVYGESVSLDLKNGGDKDEKVIEKLINASI